MISPDGRWWWDGRQWRSRLVEGELDLFWFTSTPQWFERVAITGLIGLIPIVGQINLYGWTLSGTDMLKQRWRELPPAGFQYLERGVAPFIVMLVYGLTVALILASLALGGIVMIAGKPAHVALGIVVLAVLAVLALAWWLTSVYLLAAMFVCSDRFGIGRALNPAVLFAHARRNSGVSVRAGVTYLVAAVVLAVGGVAASFVIPFAGLALSVGLPAVMAMITPLLSRFDAGIPERGPSAQGR